MEKVIQVIADHLFSGNAIDKIALKKQLAVIEKDFIENTHLGEDRSIAGHAARGTMRTLTNALSTMTMVGPIVQYAKNKDNPQMTTFAEKAFPFYAHTDSQQLLDKNIEEIVDIAAQNSPR
ncbi:hypothetical protein L3V82_11005 [Thiotrichales bacterium 19S3-7]|nr:hypothetical protein [Thiotrichales bacterium 19S3-7]MCF6802708.1 hypothetical protein [Thiotrichales bacterium 19S3-11]